jgi:hypothetical protein
MAAFASLPLYHTSKAIPFAGAGTIMAAGSVIVAASAVVFARRRQARALQLEAERQTA